MRGACRFYRRPVVDERRDNCRCKVHQPTTRIVWLVTQTNGSLRREIIVLEGPQRSLLSASAVRERERERECKTNYAECQTRIDQAQQRSIRLYGQSGGADFLPLSR